MVASAYLVALGIAEALTTLIAPLAGMILHGLILITLLIHAALSTNDQLHRFLVVLALAPLIRLLSLTLPLIQFPPIYWYAVVGIPLYLAAFLCARSTGLTGHRIGLRLSWRAIPTQLLIGISGLLLGYIEYLILRPEPLVADLSWAMVLLSALILLVFTGLLEEIIFRGMMQISATQYLGRLGIIYVAILFTILHLGYRSLIDVIFVFAVGVVFGFIVHRTGSLAGVSLSHGLTNISLYLIFPILLANPVINNSASTTSISPGDIAPNVVFQTNAILFPTQTYTPNPSQTHLEGDIAIPMTGSTNNDGEINAASVPVLIMIETTPADCSPPPSWAAYTVQAGETP
jgi:membrane protease YdiL (CAAX protease family)